jgi:hypothetical protein
MEPRQTESKCVYSRDVLQTELNEPEISAVSGNDFHLPADERMRDSRIWRSGSEMPKKRAEIPETISLVGKKRADISNGRDRLLADRVDADSREIAPSCLFAETGGTLSSLRTETRN